MIFYRANKPVEMLDIQEQIDLLTELSQQATSVEGVARALIPFTDLKTSDLDESLEPIAVIQHYCDRFSERLPSPLQDFLKSLITSSAGDEKSLVVVKELMQSNADPHNITSFLADGGIGRVWLAHDQQVQREVVLKQLLPDFQGNENAKARFVHEAQVTGSLQHPNIVPVYSMNWDDEESPFYTMKYIRGSTLASCLKRYHDPDNADSLPPDFQTLLAYFVSICQAIAYAHDRKMMHRDLKPENIAIGEFGEVTVLDWGLAERYYDESEDATPGKKRSGVVGTPNYMPPEQADPDNVEAGPGSDIYSLGAILYEILCGGPPRHATYQQQGLNPLLDSVIRGDIPDATNNCPRKLTGLAHIANKCLSCSINDRYLSVNDLLQDIDNWSTDQPISAKPDSPLQRVARSIRRNQRALLATGVILPTTLIVLQGFVMKYNSEYSRLQEAKRTEVEKQGLHLETKRRLTEAIQLAQESKESAEQYAELANRNRDLANTRRQEYEREQMAAETARPAHVLATTRAEDSAAKARDSTRASNEARVVADQNRTKAEMLEKQLRRRLFDSTVQRADQAVANDDHMGALTWLTASIDQGSKLELPPELIQHQVIKYSAAKSNSPALRNLWTQKTFFPGFQYDPATDSIYLAGESQGGYYVWKLNASTLQLDWRHPIEALPQALSLSQDADVLCYALPTPNGNSEIHFLEPKSGELAAIPTIQTPICHALYITTDSLVVISKRTVQMYDRRSFALRRKMPDTELSIYSSTLSSDASKLVTTHGRYEARLWDTSQGNLLAEPIRQSAPIIGTLFQPQSNQLFIHTDSSGGYSVAPPKFQIQHNPRPTLLRRKGESFTAVDTHSHGLFDVYGSNFGRVFVRLRNGSQLFSPQQFTGAVKTIHISNSNRLIAVQSGNRLVHIIDTASRSVVARNIAHASDILDFKFSSNDRFLIVLTDGGELRQWDLALSANAPEYIEPFNEYVHVSVTDQWIYSVQDNGVIELRATDAPGQLVHSVQLKVPLGNSPTFCRVTNGFYIVSPEMLCFVSSVDDKLDVRKQRLYADSQATSIRAETGALAIAHDDRTISIFRPSQPTSYKRIESLRKSYMAVSWISPGRLAGITQTPDAISFLAEVIDLESGEVIHSEVLSGIVSRDDQTRFPRFLTNNEGKPQLVVPRGTVASAPAADTFQYTQPVQSNLVAVTPSNPALGILENGRIIRSTDARQEVYDTITPEDATRFTRSGYFAVYDADSLAIYDTDLPSPVAPPIPLRYPPNSVAAIEDDGKLVFYVASKSGIAIHTFDIAAESPADLTLESLAITGTAVKLPNVIVATPKQTFKAFDTYVRIRSATEGSRFPFGWLLNNSSTISPNDWAKHIDAITDLYYSQRETSSQVATPLLDSVVRAKIGIHQYIDAYDELIDGYQYTSNARHLYRACVLAAWLTDYDRFTRALESLANASDLQAGQEYVDLSIAANLLEHTIELPNLNEAYERYRDTPSTNPVVLRAHLANAHRLNDKPYLDELLSNDTPWRTIPTRNYYQILRLLVAATQNEESPDTDPLAHQNDILPSLQSGNPGPLWEERCVLDTMLKRLQVYLNKVSKP